MKTDIDNYCIWNDYRISGFFKEYRWLSNFYLCNVRYEGVLYPSSENAYMAGKTLDLEIRKKFENISPKDARKLGQQIELRPNWNEIRLEVMYEVLLDKFSRNEDLAVKLLETAPKILEENNWWNDKFWGICNGDGFNWLGRLLMEVRSEI